jgi:hemerythrin-like metal-binding protein
MDSSPEGLIEEHTMPGLVWSDALSLSMPAMDATHQEFIDLLAAVEHADDASLVRHWHALVEHTHAHFANEDKWMRDTGFAPNNCHSTQHAVVLEVLRDGAKRGAQGDLAAIRQMAAELAVWFPHHAQSMDMGLSLHLKSLGYDPETGAVGQPDALPAQAISGCGGTCGTPTERAAA